jgi:hypothetical protein
VRKRFRQFYSPGGVSVEDVEDGDSDSGGRNDDDDAFWGTVNTEQSDGDGGGDGGGGGRRERPPPAELTEEQEAKIDANLGRGRTFVFAPLDERNAHFFTASLLRLEHGSTDDTQHGPCTSNHSDTPGGSATLHLKQQLMRCHPVWAIHVTNRATPGSE